MLMWELEKTFSESIDKIPYNICTDLLQIKKYKFTPYYIQNIFFCQIEQVLNKNYFTNQYQNVYATYTEISELIVNSESDFSKNYNSKKRTWEIYIIVI